MQIGDKVKIIDRGHIYFIYKEMAELMNATKWKGDYEPSKKEGIVKCIKPHIRQDNLLVLVDTGKEEIIVDIKGLKVIPRREEIIYG